MAAVVTAVGLGGRRILGVCFDFLASLHFAYLSGRPQHVGSGGQRWLHPRFLSFAYLLLVIPHSHTHLYTFTILFTRFENPMKVGDLMMVFSWKTIEVSFPLFDLTMTFFVNCTPR